MFMRVVLSVLLGAAIAVAATSATRAAIVITVDKSSQQMAVSVDGVPRYSWSVSTGRAGYGTPSGTYHPQRLEKSWFSREYYNSPMPHSIFFHGGYAIHGSYEINRLGGPASHGCIRLHPSNAATLFRWWRARAWVRRPSWCRAKAARQSRGGASRCRGTRPRRPSRRLGPATRRIVTGPGSGQAPTSQAPTSIGPIASTERGVSGSSVALVREPDPGNRPRVHPFGG
jgi:hypothetical protein